MLSGTDTCATVKCQAPISWINASAECSKLDAHLARIGTRVAVMQIVNWPNIPQGSSIWLSGRNIGDTWVDQFGKDAVF
mgnify:CR=1 FL=1